MNRLRFSDLVDRGIVRNRVTLKNWIQTQGFPEGQMTGPNTRSWSEDEIERWLKDRPKKHPNPSTPPRRTSASPEAA